VLVLPFPRSKIQGAFGLEYSSINDKERAGISSASSSCSPGDMTRIGGSYWNFSGYYVVGEQEADRGIGRNALRPD